MTVGAILLAAGSARRMGEDKLLADLGGRPLALHALEAIGTAGLGEAIVALAPRSGLAPLIGKRAAIAEVADHALGMAHSLAAAIAAVPDDWAAAIICLADMPFVRAETIAAVVAHAREDAVVRPSFEGRAGNPVLWGRDHFAALVSLRGDQGGRSLLRDRSVTPVECDDPGVLIDIDTPEALAEARAHFR